MKLGTVWPAALAAVSLLMPSTSGARTEREAPELAALFEREHLTGTVVMLDPPTDTLHIANAVRARERFVPASTFKIPNSLIGPDVGAVASIDEVLPSGGKPQRFNHSEHDMNLRDAIKASNVPVYRELARGIGLERMHEGLLRIGYGNMETGDVVDRFWLDEPLAIRAIEQVEFLRRLAEERLPLKKDAIAAVKAITLLDRTYSYALHGKTAWYWPDGRRRTGRVVGRAGCGRECLRAAGACSTSAAAALTLKMRASSITALTLYEAHYPRLPDLRSARRLAGTCTTFCRCGKQSFLVRGQIQSQCRERRSGQEGNGEEETAQGDGARRQYAQVERLHREIH
jgi:beta-lactamase class D